VAVSRRPVSCVGAHLACARGRAITGPCDKRAEASSAPTQAVLCRRGAPCVRPRRALRGLATSGWRRAPPLRKPCCVVGAHLACARGVHSEVLRQAGGGELHPLRKPCCVVGAHLACTPRSYDKRVEASSTPTQALLLRRGAPCVRPTACSLAFLREEGGDAHGTRFHSPSQPRPYENPALA